jgi:hypothetical protein
MKSTVITAIISLSLASLLYGQAPFISDQIVRKTSDALMEEHGQVYADRIQHSVQRVRMLWREQDGDSDDFRQFCSEHFVSDPKALREMTLKVDRNLGLVKGYLHEIRRPLEAPVNLGVVTPAPVDFLFKQSIPAVDYYKSKLAFFIALNFPMFTLEDKIRLGPAWDHTQWTAARLGDLFTVRARPQENAPFSGLEKRKTNYINNYLICMDRILDDRMQVMFPAGLKLSCHHGLRDRLKGLYLDPEGLEKQQLIYRIMLRVVDQSIPRCVINNPDYYWQPQSNEVYTRENGQYVPITDGKEPEGVIRYQYILDTFRKHRTDDPLYLITPTFIQRRFAGQQMREQDVEALIRSILESPVAPHVAEMISGRLGRPLQPQDIWYNGFHTQSSLAPEALDKMTQARYPTPRAFQDDIFSILSRVGFPAEKARFMADHTVVDRTQVGGHANGAQRRGGNTHIRVVFTDQGLHYKDFRIAMHELGHAVHQNFARYGVESHILGDVPTNGFKEAIAEVFAYRNMEVLGLAGQDNAAHVLDNQALANFWYLFEHGANALTEMRVWRWMYAHPDADVKRLKQAVLDIARSTWNEFCEPVLGHKDSHILAVYSHTVTGPLYLHNYVLGNIIMYQMYDYLQDRDLAGELERMCRLGRLTPDLWMQRAVGSPVSSAPLLRAVHKVFQ